MYSNYKFGGISIDEILVPREGNQREANGMSAFETAFIQGTEEPSFAKKENLQSSSITGYKLDGANSFYDCAIKQWKPSFDGIDLGPRYVDEGLYTCYGFENWGAEGVVPSTLTNEIFRYQETSTTTTAQNTSIYTEYSDGQLKFYKVKGGVTSLESAITYSESEVPQLIYFVLTGGGGGGGEGGFASHGGGGGGACTVFGIVPMLSASFTVGYGGYGGAGGGSVGGNSSVYVNSVEYLRANGGGAGSDGNWWTDGKGGSGGVLTTFGSYTNYYFGSIAGQAGAKGSSKISNRVARADMSSNFVDYYNSILIINNADNTQSAGGSSVGNSGTHLNNPTAGAGHHGGYSLGDDGGHGAGGLLLVFAYPM